MIYTPKQKRKSRKLQTLSILFSLAILLSLAKEHRSDPEHIRMDGGGVLGTLKTEVAEAKSPLPPSAADPCLLEAVHCESENYQPGFVSAIDQAASKWNVPRELIFGIANAESSLGENSKGFNAWGVKKNATQFKSYNNWDEAASDVARILRNFYLDEGKDTPEKIMMKYVGYHSADWLKNVYQFYKP